MKLIIHDGKKEFEEKLKQLWRAEEEELCFISSQSSIHQCIGCFGCWVKTPTKCVIKDGYDTIPTKCRDASELIIISECMYGMYSPFVKNVLDRAIGYIHPDFVHRGGEMHHKLRYQRVLPVKIFFYGNINSQERELAEIIVRANGLNMNWQIKEISFAKDQEGVMAQLGGDETAPHNAMAVESWREPAPMQLQTEKVALICASPKSKLTESASSTLLTMLEAHLPSQKVVRLNWSQNSIPEADLHQIAECQVLVFSFPLYVDCLPSHVLRCLIQLGDFLQKNKEIPYICGIVNNGFFDAKQNKPALAVIQNWSRRIGAHFVGGLAVGGGGMAVGVYQKSGPHGPLQIIDAHIQRLAEQIVNPSKEDGSIETVHPSIPEFLYKLAAQTGWRISIKRNGLRLRDLNRK